MEKFFDIKCRMSGLVPNCVVLVATIRALKMHGGGPKVTPGKPLGEAYTKENIELLEKGVCNMQRNIAIAKMFGVPVVVAINRFPTDTDAEVELARKAAIEAGAEGAYLANHWAEGGQGAVELAEAVVAACEKPTDFKLLYPDTMSIKEKIETIAKQIYQAAAVHFEPKAEEQIASYERAGLSHLPICMAKTHLSLSHDPNLKGVPTGFTVPVREVRGLGRRRVPLPAAGHDAHHAGPALARGVHGRGSRRRRQRGRHVLSPATRNLTKKPGPPSKRGGLLFLCCSQYGNRIYFDHENHLPQNPERLLATSSRRATAIADLVYRCKTRHMEITCRHKKRIPQCQCSCRQPGGI